MTWVKIVNFKILNFKILNRVQVRFVVVTI